MAQNHYKVEVYTSNKNQFLNSPVLVGNFDILANQTEELTAYFASESKEMGQSNWKIKEHLNAKLAYKEQMWSLNGMIKEQGSLISVQFIFKHQPTAFQIHFNSQAKNIEWVDFEALFSLKENSLKNEIFSNFPIPISEQLYNQQDCLVSALANLHGGLVFKYGNLQFTQLEEQRKQSPKPIFSFTPSRTRFSWSFLWDDGFHNVVASKLNLNLTFCIIEYWLNTQNDEGWIPREQPRGKEAEGLCNCPNFAQKDNRDANPPSLILSLDIDETGWDANFQLFLQKNYPKLVKWHDWYVQKLATKIEDYIFFKWWDKDDHTSSMNSGLDDFPRTNNPSETPFAHIDCQSWMFYFSKVMEKLSKLMKNPENEERFRLLKENIKHTAEVHFLDKSDHIMKDLVHPSYPTIKTLQQITHSQHIGYPSVLPLAFGMLDQKSEEFIQILQKIMNKGQLGSEYGIRSLSKDDSKFGRANNYWTGPIWININYLTLRGLFKYYQEEAKQEYHILKNRITSLVCQNWQRTSYFYENYNKHEDGKGSDAHPFTGWTATIALILSEKY